MGEFVPAKRHAETAVRVLKNTWGEKSPGYAHALVGLAATEAELHELGSAEQHFREASEILEPAVREGLSGLHMLLYAGAQLYLARLLNDQERFAEAEPFARRGCEIHGFNARHTYSKYLEGQLDLARSLSGQGKNAEAEIVFACLIKAAQPNPSPQATVRTLTRYGEHLRRIHREADAEQLESRVRKLAEQIPNVKPNGEPGTDLVPLTDIPRSTERK
jgi:tetratricopeptide (TPR) repeat protein